MRDRRTRFRLFKTLTASWLVLLPLPSVAPAQRNETRGGALELEVLKGYTGVDVEKWARARNVYHRDQASYGANLRFFLVHLGNAHAGFEVGSQRLLRYTLLTKLSDFTSIRVIHTVSAPHVGVVARFRLRPSLDVDAGGGFRFFREPLPATHVAVRYRAFGNRKWSIPLGVRMDMILDDNTTAVSMSFASGLFIRL